MLLSVTPVNVTSQSAVGFPDDIFFKLCMPRAVENADNNIHMIVGVLDFVRSAHLDVHVS